MSNKPHDALARRSLSQPELAGAYLASVLPEGLVRQLDLGSLKLEEGSYIDPALSERQADFVYQVDFAGREALLYVLLEHQRCVDPIMAARFYVYTGRVLNNYLSQHPNARQVPPIVPVLLYNGSEAWSAPTQLQDLFGLPADSEQLLPLLPSLSYRVDDLRRTTDEEIEARAVPTFGTVSLLLLRHGADGDAELFDFVRQVAPRWLNQLRDRDDLISAFTYILNVSSAEADNVLEVMRSALEPQIQEVAVTAADQLRREGLEAGLEQGLEAGVLEGKRELLSELLQHRFSLSEEDLASLHSKHLASAAKQELDAWAKKVLDAKSVDEVFAS